MLKVAMLSKWHVHAPEYARRLSEMDDVQLTCVWDEIPERGQAWAKELGTAFEPDLDKLLARETWTPSASTPPPTCTRIS